MRKNKPNIDGDKKKHDDTHKYVTVVELRLMKAGVVTMQQIDTEIRTFSSVKKAYRWLRENDFYYGRRSFLKYEKNEYEWCNTYDRWDKYIAVSIMKIQLDDVDCLEF